MTKDGKTEEYRRFQEEVHFNLLEKMDIIEQAMDIQKNYPNDIPIMQYSELAFDNDFVFEIIEMGDGVVFYNFKYDNNLVPELDYIFNFGARYNWKE